MATQKEIKAQERADAITRLRELIKPGDTVYTILRSVSRSGMSRQIDVTIIDNDGPFDISWLVARALDYRRAPNGALKVGGCGMDMGFSVVYNLSDVLYGGDHGYKCLGDSKDYSKRCPSNEHVNSPRAPFHRNRVHHDGYALHHRWM